MLLVLVFWLYLKLEASQVAYARAIAKKGGGENVVGEGQGEDEEGHAVTTDHSGPDYQWIGSFMARTHANRDSEARYTILQESTERQRGKGRHRAQRRDANTLRQGLRG